MQVIELPEAAGRTDALGFSPDGGLLAVSCRGRVFVIDTADGRVRTLWNEPDTDFQRGSGLSFTAEGRAVVVHHCLSHRGAIKVHDVGLAEVARDFAMSGPDICEPGPGGRSIYVAVHPTFSQSKAEIIRWNPLTGEAAPPFARRISGIQRLAVSADEMWLAGSYFDTIRVWDIGGKKPPVQATRRVAIANARIVSLAISFSGEFIASGSLYGASGALHIASVRTRELWRVGECPRAAGRLLAFHPERPVVAMQRVAGEVSFYDASARTELLRFAWRLGEITALCFSPDGLRCAAADESGKVVIWDVDV